MNEYQFGLILKIYEQSVYCGDTEPSRFLFKSNGKIVLLDENDEEAEIGSFSVIFVDVESALIENEYVYDLFDSNSTTLDCLTELYSNGSCNFKPKVNKAAAGNDYLWNPNLLILDRLTVNAEHQGHGVGLFALRELIHRFRAGAGLIAMKPFPLQFESEFHDGSNADEANRIGLAKFNLSQQKATAKLKRYYGRLGFKSVPRSKYMVLNPEYPLPSVKSLLES